MQPEICCNSAGAAPSSAGIGLKDLFDTRMLRHLSGTKNTCAYNIYIYVYIYFFIYIYIYTIDSDIISPYICKENPKSAWRVVAQHLNALRAGDFDFMA